MKRRVWSKLAAVPALQDLREQWHKSRLARLGVLAASIIVAVELLSAWGESVSRMRAEAQRIGVANSTLEAEIRRVNWVEQGARAQQRSRELRGLLWEGDPSLVQAGLQDWLQAAASKSGLMVREISVSKSLLPFSSSSTPPPEVLIPGPAGVARPKPEHSGPDWSALDKDGVSLWRARVRLDFSRAATLSFLNEVAQSPRWLRVDRLHVRLSSPAPTAELELRALAVTPGDKP